MQVKSVRETRSSDRIADQHKISHSVPQTSKFSDQDTSPSPAANTTLYVGPNINVDGSTWCSEVELSSRCGSDHVTRCRPITQRRSCCHKNNSYDDNIFISSLFVLELQLSVMFSSQYCTYSSCGSSRRTSRLMDRHCAMHCRMLQCCYCGRDVKTSDD